MGGYLSTGAAENLKQESSMNRRDSTLSRDSIPNLSQSFSDGGRVGKLHDTVLFDENDFVDDNDLDLDSDSSAPTLVATASTDITYPSLPSTVPSKPAISQPPASSVPLPWSSSPIQHKAPIAATVSRGTDAAPSSSSAPKATTGKRRTLPWHEEHCDSKSNENVDPRDENQVNDAGTGPLQHGPLQHGPLQHGPLKHGPAAKVQKVLEAQRKRKLAAKTDAGEAFTPLPKDKPDSLFPWNKTASAVKEEQKALRHGHKKLVKDVESNREAKVMTTKDKKVPRVFLSDEQRKVLDLVADSKKSVFFTGSAGTGKSVLLREVIRVLRDKYMREIDRVAVTASTGLAACNIGGVTLHSFAGIGLGKEAVPELVKKIKRNQKAKLRWMRTKVLIIDEISMVDGDLFDKLEGIARIIRNNGRPFGGIQLVITGDFFQLPPVPDYGKIAKFAFDAATWNTSIEHTIGLTQVFRQKDPGMLRFPRYGVPGAN